MPTTATAVTGNLAIVKPTKAGYASVTKDPTATPATSTINFPTGSVRANGVFAPLDANHALSIVYKASAGATTDVVLDITGYFEPGTAGLRFVPLAPSRIMDSRSTAVLSGITGEFTSSAPKTLEVQGHWGVPGTAQAVTGNLTVTGQKAAGFVSATPDPTATPTTSTLNFPLGDTIGNGIVAPLNGSGESSFVYKASAGKTAQPHPRPVGLLRVGRTGPLRPALVAVTRRARIQAAGRPRLAAALRQARLPRPRPAGGPARPGRARRPRGRGPGAPRSPRPPGPSA